MQAPEFPGRDRLLAMIDAAVAAGSPEATTDALRRGLSRLIGSGEVSLPDCVFEPVDDHYARRELHRCDRLGYSIVAMTWGPGQGTPIHDHSGLWCVEGVWHGELEITQYEPQEREGDRVRFEQVGRERAGVGSAGSLIPPHEYHAIRNPSADRVAVSLHIYQRALTCCAVFQPDGGEWHRRCARELGLDEAA